MNKMCGRCGEKKDISRFGKRGSVNSGSLRVDFKSYCKDCCNLASIVKNRNNKAAALRHYGGAICKCCGITEVDFLSLDHVDNNGSSLRKIHGSGTAFFGWLKKNRYPQDLNLQVLCHNCNMGRHINGGICPHKFSNAMSSNR